MTDQRSDGANARGPRPRPRAARWAVFAVFKNPTSHHPVDYSSTVAAEAEAVLPADLLLRMLDDAAPLWPPG